MVCNRTCNILWRCVTTTCNMYWWCVSSFNVLWRWVTTCNIFWLYATNKLMRQMDNIKFLISTNWNFFLQLDWLLMRSKRVPGPTNDLLIDKNYLQLYKAQIHNRQSLVGPAAHTVYISADEVLVIHPCQAVLHHNWCHSSYRFCCCFGWGSLFDWISSALLKLLQHSQCLKTITRYRNHWGKIIQLT